MKKWKFLGWLCLSIILALVALVVIGIDFSLIEPITHGMPQWINPMAGFLFVLGIPLVIIGVGIALVYHEV